MYIYIYLYIYIAGEPRICINTAFSGLCPVQYVYRFLKAGGCPVVECQSTGSSCQVLNYILNGC